MLDYYSLRWQANDMAALGCGPPPGLGAAPEATLLPQLNHPVVNETLGTWGQSFVFTLINLATTPHPPMLIPLECISFNTVK